MFHEFVDIACESDQARAMGWEVRQDIVRGIEAPISGGLVPFDGVDAPCAIRGGTPNLAIALLVDTVPGGQAPAVQEDADATRMAPCPASCGSKVRTYRPSPCANGMSARCMAWVERLSCTQARTLLITV